MLIFQYQQLNAVLLHLLRHERIISLVFIHKQNTKHYNIKPQKSNNFNYISNFWKKTVVWMLAESRGRNREKKEERRSRNRWEGRGKEQRREEEKEPETLSAVLQKSLVPVDMGLTWLHARGVHVLTEVCERFQHSHQWNALMKCHVKQCACRLESKQWWLFC